MRAAGALLAIVLGASGLVACSLFADLGGLSAGDDDATDASVTPDAEASTDGGVSDAEPVVPVADGSTEGGPDVVTDGAGKYYFLDEFARGDTPSGLGGNGWQEKRIGFNLNGGRAVRYHPGAGGSDYRNNVSTRPASEAVRDVEVRVEFGFLVGGGGWVQIHARVQTATLAETNSLDSYLLFRNLDQPGDTRFIIGRQRVPGTWTQLAAFDTSVPIDTSTTYRMRLRVKGTSPVEVEGYVDQQVGLSWQQIGGGGATDSSPTRIEGAGVTAIGAGNDPTGAYSYDRFEVQEL
jgi:hypothetical protein